MASVTVVKRKGREKLYVVWRDAETRKQIWRQAGTDDEEMAQQVADQVKAILEGQCRVESVRSLLAEVMRVPVPVVRVRLNQLIGRWEEEWRPRRTRKRTDRNKVNKVSRWTEWMAERHPEVKFVHEVTPQMAREYMVHLECLGNAGQTMNNKLSALHSVFQDIMITAFLERNVWDYVPRAEANHVARRALTLEEVQRIWAAAKAFQKDESYEGKAEKGFWAAAIAMAFHTGLRLGDICELHGDEYHMERGVLELVENKKWKKGQQLVLPLHPDFAFFLPDGPVDGYIWPNAAKLYQQHNGAFIAEFGAICRQANIETERDARDGERRMGTKVKVVGFHSLRATYVTIARDRGAPLDDIRETVGHTTGRMTQRYNSSIAAARRVADLMPGLKVG